MEALRCSYSYQERYDKLFVLLCNIRYVIQALCNDIHFCVNVMYVISILAHTLFASGVLFRTGCDSNRNYRNNNNNDNGSPPPPPAPANVDMAQLMAMQAQMMQGIGRLTAALQDACQHPPP